MALDPAALLSPRILVVDDERQIHASLRLRLGHAYELDFSFEARDGLEKIQRRRYDLCLADIHMPKMDGLNFIDAAQQLDPCLGFVVITAFDSHENLRRAIPLQVYEFLSKPLPEKADFEGRIPQWIERTRARRREQELARDAGAIAQDREVARLEREVEFMASETARDALWQVAGLITTINAQLLSGTTLLAARARTDPSLAHILRIFTEARKTGDATQSVAAGFFDSAYGNRDTSPALPHEGIPQAISIALRMSFAEESNKTIDFSPLDSSLPIRGLSGIDFLLMMVPVLAAALSRATPNTTVGIQAVAVARLDVASKDPARRSIFWFNRRSALVSHPAMVFTVTARGESLTEAEVEAWYKGDYAPLRAVPAQRLLLGIQKCHGLLGVAVSPPAERFGLVLMLPT